MARIAVVSFRLGGTDGVAIEARKWIDAFSELGHDVTTIAGEGSADTLLPGLAITAEAPPTPTELGEALGDADLVVVENLASLPLNVRARDVLYDALEGRRALFHHHDLPWQRPHLAQLRGPRDAPGWHHVTINAISARELHERGIEAVTMMNSFDCAPPLGRRAKARASVGVENERLVLMPTRALPRKNVAGALVLCEALDAVLWLLGPAEDGYDQELEALLDSSPVDVRRGPRDDIDVHDAYAACDLVVMPSTWEGFGNPVLESVTHRRPLALYPYPVAREIMAYGFRFFDLVDIADITNYLSSPNPELLANNLTIAEAHFNIAALPARLRLLLASMGIEKGQLSSNDMVIQDDRPQHAERREQLLRVATSIFAERGFQSATMDDIAKEAGFTKPILYQYFESKTDLYHEIVAQLADSLLSSLRKAVGAAETPRAKIEVAFRVYFEMVVSETDTFRILFIHSHEGDTAKELRALELGLISFVIPFMDSSFSEEHRRQLAGGVVGIAEGAAIVWLEQQESKGWPAPAPGAAERLAARSATLAWGGLRTVHEAD